MSGKISVLHGLTPDQVAPREVVSYELSTLFGTGRTERYNPDDLASHKGLGIYSKMMIDEQVKAVMNFRMASITSRGYEFKFPEDSLLSDDERKRRIDFFQYNITAMRGSFQDALRAILKGHVYGFSLTEKVFDVIDYDGRPMIGVVQLLPRNCMWFRFFTDKYGTLLRTEQWIANDHINVDIAKFIHYVHAPEEDRYYGQSDLRAAYRPWYIKDVVTKLYTIYLERFAGGFAWAEVDSTSGIQSGHPEFTRLQTAMENIRNLAGLILPQGVKLNVFNPSSTGEYREALTYFDLAIAKSALVPNLLGLSHTGQTGAYSQSQTQLEAYFMTIADDTARLEDCLNDQLFADLGRMNFGDENYPCFTFKPASAEHIKWIVDTWKSLCGSAAVQTTEEDEAHLRKLLEMPARKDDSVLMKEENMKLEQKYAPEPATVPFTADAAKILIRESNDHLVSSIKEMFTRSREPVQDPNVPSNPEVSKGDSGKSRAPVFNQKHGNPIQVDKITFARAVARVDFAIIDRRTTVLSDDISEQIARLTARSVRRLLSDERLDELLTQDTGDIGQLSFEGADVGKIKAAFKEGLSRAWEVGSDAARRELQKADLAQFVLKFDTLRNKAADYFESNGFRMAQNMTDGMRAVIQQDLLQAVKTGARSEEVAAGIYDRLIRKGFMTLAAVEREESRLDILDQLTKLLEDTMGTVNVAAYLNTLVRTNTFEALNEARFAAFEDPDLEGFVVAYEYSAIMDNVTTEICSSLNDSIYSNDSEVWDTLRPPNHYNCRSLLVPVFATDGWNGVESPPPTVEPQEGF